MSQQLTHLKIAKIGGFCVEKADASKLDGRIQTHVFEAAEAGHKRAVATHNMYALTVCDKQIARLIDA